MTSRTRALRLAFLLGGLCVCTASLASAAASAPAGGETCNASYAYAGAENSSDRYGIRAVLTTIKAPKVTRSGHVAGWVGIGGPEAGPIISQANQNYSFNGNLPYDKVTGRVSAEEMRALLAEEKAQPDGTAAASGQDQRDA